MEKITGTCPGCRKKCDLEAPRCHIGEAYAKTGVLPGRKYNTKADLPGQAEGGAPDAAEDRRLSEAMRNLSRAIRHGEGTLSALSAEEKAQLGALIDKAWAGVVAEWNARRDGHGHHHVERGEDCGRKDKHGHHGDGRERKR